MVFGMATVVALPEVRPRRAVSRVSKSWRSHDARSAVKALVARQPSCAPRRRHTLSSPTRRLHLPPRWRTKREGGGARGRAHELCLQRACSLAPTLALFRIGSLSRPQPVAVVVGTAKRYFSSPLIRYGKE